MEKKKRGLAQARTSGRRVELRGTGRRVATGGTLPEASERTVCSEVSNCSEVTVFYKLFFHEFIYLIFLNFIVLLVFGVIHWLTVKYAIIFNFHQIFSSLPY